MANRNHLELIFQKRLMQFEKKYTPFFLILRSSILKLIYHCDFRSLISKIWPWGIPLNPLSNSTGLIWFGFFKEKLCPISHNDLIMDWFSRENFYDLPRVTVSSFGSEIDITKTKVHVLAAMSYKIPIWCWERVLLWFSHIHLFEMKFGSLRKS